MFAPINNTKLTDAVYADMQKTIEFSPAAFDIIIFKADPEAATTANNTEMIDVVGSLEARENEVSFSHPISSMALEIPSEGYQTELMVAMGGMSDGFQDDPIAMLILEPNVPEQSVIYIKEVIGDTEKIKTYFIDRVQPIAKEGLAGAKYYLLPFSMDHSVLQDAVDDVTTPIIDQDAENEASSFLSNL